MNQLLRPFFRENLRVQRNTQRVGLGLLVFFGLLLANLARAQLLTNGGFEAGLGSWSSSLSSGGTATFANVATNVHSGTNALLVTVSNAGTASNSVQLVSSSFAASSSETYVLRFWINSSVLYANMGINLNGATPEFRQIPFEISTNPAATGTIGNYQEYLYAFKASGTVSIAFNFQTAAQYWLDDVEVLDLTNNDGFDVSMTYLWQWGQWNFFQTNNLKIGWTGGDNDKSRLLPDGSVAWIFNDSYATTLSSNIFYSNIRGDSSLPRNCVVHQIGTNLIWMNNGASTFFVPTNAANLYWIGDSVVESNKLVVLLNEVNATAITNVNLAVATISLPGLTLDNITELSSPGTDNFGSFINGDDGYYYIYNGPKVARVPVGSLAVDSAWRYWNGSTWGTDHTQSVGLTNLVDPWSTVRLGTSNYVTIYFPYLDFTQIMAQYSPTPMGPWSSGVLVYTVPSQWGEIMYAPNICAGTGSNGVYTIGYSDNGSPENWFSKTAADKSWYNPHFVTANLLAMSPYTLNNGIDVPDFGFETPSISDYQYNPSGGLWTFSGASPNGSGLVGNGSLFGNPNAPQGVQAAFVQEYGTISQSISGFTPGLNYTISFFAAERINDAQSWNVAANGVVIASYNPGSSSTSYVKYTATFKATAATQTVAFVGTDLASGDNTVFIDDVRITPPPILSPININIQQVGGNLVLSWPQGVLLEATNLTGPWNANYATSPYTNQPSHPQMFYQVQVQ
jgi:hypothetical protein